MTSTPDLFTSAPARLFLDTLNEKWAQGTSTWLECATMALNRVREEYPQEREPLPTLWDA